VSHLTPLDLMVSLSNHEVAATASKEDRP
jgi:hypothetical protein